jgi:hypothetical protein
VAGRRAAALGQPLAGLQERAVLAVHQELDHVARGRAAETPVVLVVHVAGVDPKAGRALGVERAQAAEGASALAAQGDAAGSHDVGQRTLPLERLGVDQRGRAPSGHGLHQPA